MIVIRRIVGRSMAPTLVPGQTVVAVRKARPYTGSLVIIRHNGREKIKRVHRVKHGLVYVAGDNPSSSTDSRHFGWLETKAIVAVVVWVGKRQSS
jgi:phage repressor protein C with HTH and peptisase S24 domain